MTQFLGETRDAMALGVWNTAEMIANQRKNDVKPFYIIYAAKPDPHLRGAMIDGQVAHGGIRQAFRLSYVKPPMILGQLVWFVNNPQGLFEFVPHLSSPPDIPLDPSMLSDKSEDKSERVMNRGQDLNVLLS